MTPSPPRKGSTDGSREALKSTLDQAVRSGSGGRIGDRTSYATTVEIDFESAESGTIIRLREYGYQDTPSGLRAMLNCAAGWGEALTVWKFYVEHGIRY
jgi:hypothetical protein